MFKRIVWSGEDLVQSLSESWNQMLEVMQSAESNKELELQMIWIFSGFSGFLEPQIFFPSLYDEPSWERMLSVVLGCLILNFAGQWVLLPPQIPPIHLYQIFLSLALLIEFVRQVSLSREKPESNLFCCFLWPGLLLLLWFSNSPHIHNLLTISYLTLSLSDII